MDSENYYPLSIGSITGYVINDGVQEEPLDPSIDFPDVMPRDMNQALEAYEIDKEAVRLCRNCVLLEIEDLKILVDTGLGHAWDGELAAGLNDVGIHPENIDHVIITHCHGDHVMGALDKENKLVFKKAHYWMWHQEWDFWFNADRFGDEKEYPADHPTKFFTKEIEERVTLIDSDEEFLPGICAIPAAGHTNGHMALKITSEDLHLLIVGDAFLYPFQIEYLDWCTPYDRYPEFTIESRRRLLKLAEELDADVLAYHFESPGIGHVQQFGSGWRWVEMG
jgi:glyoxylase-like metal-dependent hydrolase (beta-lactamase superfamily II)